MDFRLWNWRNLLLVFLVFMAGMVVWHYFFSVVSMTQGSTQGNY